jgi:hypothetical protein
MVGVMAGGVAGVTSWCAAAPLARVGGGDPTVDVRECTNEDCLAREPDGPDA